MSSRAPLATIVVAIAACKHPAPAPAPPAAAACRLDEPPEVVREDGAAILLRWELDDRPVLWSPALPDDAGYRAYRDAIRADGAELRVPIADRAPAADDAERERWRREDHNAAIVAEGLAGTLRPVSCLEALMFARQHARYSELTHPTELMTLVLRKGGRLRLYFGAGDALFPPKTVYGFDEAAADVAAGWTLDAALHNHTIVHRGDRIALGTPTLSINDVHLFRNKVEDGLRAAWVTNGVFTAEIPATDFDQFLEPPE